MQMDQQLKVASGAYCNLQHTMARLQQNLAQNSTPRTGPGGHSKGMPSEGSEMWDAPSASSAIEECSSGLSSGLDATSKLLAIGACAPDRQPSPAALTNAMAVRPSKCIASGVLITLSACTICCDSNRLWA